MIPNGLPMNMQQQTVICPSCDCPVDAEAFCEFCGAALTAASDAAAESFAECETSCSEIAPAQDVKASLAVFSSTAGETENGVSLPVQCFYNESIILVEGMSSAFNIKVCCGGKGIENLRLTLHTQSLAGGETIRRHLDAHILAPGEVREVPLGFRPPEGMYGIQPFHWTLAFRLDGKRFVYEGDTQQTIFPKDQPPENIISNVVYNIENKGHANDLKLSEAATFFEDLQSSRPPSVYKLLEQAASAPSAWVAFRFHEGVAGVELIPPPPKAIADRLTLLALECRYHLLAGDCVTIGKNRDNMLVARLFNEEGIATKAQNAKISRFHCKFLRINGKCIVVDRGMRPGNGVEKASVWGVFLENMRIPSGGEAVLPVNRTFSLSLAGDSYDKINALHFTGELFQAKDSSQPDALILRRVDHVPEAWVVLWNRIPVNKLMQGSGSGEFQRAEQAFCLFCNDSTEWLEAGKGVCVDDTHFEIKPLKQWGM